MTKLIVWTVLSTLLVGCELNFNFRSTPNPPKLEKVVTPPIKKPNKRKPVKKPAKIQDWDDDDGIPFYGVS